MSPRCRYASLSGHLLDSAPSFLPCLAAGDEAADVCAETAGGARRGGRMMNARCMRSSSSSLVEANRADSALRLRHALLAQRALRVIIMMYRTCSRRPGAIDDFGGHRKRRVKARRDLDSAWLEERLVRCQSRSASFSEKGLCGWRNTWRGCCWPVRLVGT